MNLLRELLTESVSQQMAGDTIYSAGKSLAVAAKQANELLADALEWNDPGQLLPAIAPVTKWFRQNYHTNRKDGGYGVNSALTQLKSTKKFKDLAQSALNAVDDNVNRSDPKRVSKNKQTIAIGMYMSEIIKQLPDTSLGNPAKRREYEIAAKELARQLGDFQGKVQQLARIKMKDRGIDPEAAKDKKVAKQKKQTQGSQNQQAEQLINDVLASLPKDAAAEIRQAISRSGNKLAALQQEMGKRGLG